MQVITTTLLDDPALRRGLKTMIHDRLFDDAVVHEVWFSDKGQWLVFAAINGIDDNQPEQRLNFQDESV